jgi:hypothetical protein
VVAYGCLIRRKGARREHLDYIYRVLMSQHPRFTATYPLYAPRLNRPKNLNAVPKIANLLFTAHHNPASIYVMV